MRAMAAAFVLVLSTLGSARAPRAELKVHTLFSDHMVLQRDFACPVWGTVEPGEEITVSVAGQKKTVKSGADGKWSVKLDPMRVVTLGSPGPFNQIWVTPDLSKVDEVGFADLIPGSGHGTGGWVHVGSIEVYGKAVPRGPN